MLSVQQFLTKNAMTHVPYPLYSPNLAPRDFFCLFPWMEKVLKGKRVASVEEVKQKGRSTKRHQNQGVQNCVEQWKKCLDR